MITASSRGPLLLDPREVARRAHGSHVCHFYRAPSEALELAGSFIAEGLRLGERAIWKLPDWLKPQEARSSLSPLGPRVELALADGGLALMTQAEVYGDGAFKGGDEILRFLLAEEKAALARGFTGLRTCEDCTGKACGAQWHEFLAYERLLDASLAETKIVSLCAYDVRSTPADGLVEALGGHQCAVFRDGDAWQEVGHGLGAEGAVRRLKR